ncbi:hypothetical protein M422DRAFT_85522, partial [Sphaerobolus stellatus SS14]
MLLWINNALSTQQIRDRLLSTDSDFNKALIAYYESLHQGEFIERTKDDVKEVIDLLEKQDGYEQPTTTLQISLPECNCKLCMNNEICTKMELWWAEYDTTVNDILFRCNIHECRANWCLNNKYHKCKARFPRPCYPETKINHDGHIFFKHLEPNMNTVCPPLTYLLRCNSDATCLQSGTGVKAVIMYVTDYITKNPLKLYNMFEIL